MQCNNSPVFDAPVVDVFGDVFDIVLGQKLMDGQRENLICLLFGNGKITFTVA